MASYTTNYGLHQWESTDDFLRTDFNTDFQKIDAALAGIQADTDGKVEMVTGTYQGDGSDERTITLGFQPKAVLTMAYGTVAGYSSGSFYVYGGLALPGHPAMLDGEFSAVEVTVSGFSLYARNDHYRVNKLGKIYHYIAFR